jgi:hypothetical protein
MNDAPRSYLTPADRDAEMIEASRLRAMSLRREAVAIFWDDVARLLRRAGAALARRNHRPQVEA